MSSLDSYTKTTKEAAEGVALGVLFSAVPLLLIGAAFGLMRLMISVPMSVLGE